MSAPTLPARLTAIALALVAAAATAQDRRLSEGLKEKTVMITVSFTKGQPPEVGSGVVICQQDDHAWILTANHVFAGKSEEAWKQIRLSTIESATISFYRNFTAPLTLASAELRKQITFYTFKPEDLLLLSLPLPQRLPSTASLASPPNDQEDATISTLGYWKDRGLSWEQQAGALVGERSTSSKYLYHDGEVHEGFSGGPVFNAAGQLIAINLQRVPGERVPGGAAGQWYGLAQALGHAEVLSVIDKWVPAKCLRSAGQLSELAHLTYRKGMRAISTRRWPQAEELMRRAAEQQPLEGGSVHLEGMRYTQYLPLYHLGLALYRQGKYSEAIRQWEVSEAQGEIQQDKRYSTLERLRQKAYDRLRRTPAG
ncbi:MAG: trypsin-like peptidase domain-containing protein [Thermoanaerobaculia bacterium]